MANYINPQGWGWGGEDRSAELQAADAGKLHFIEMMDASNTALRTN